MIPVEKDYALILRHASAWERRSMEGWRDFKGGVAWVMLYGGVPAKQRIYAHGVMDEWPYHIVKCQVVSMDPRLVLKHRISRSRRGSEYWYLEDRSGNHKWGKKGPKGRVQTAYQFYKRPWKQPRPPRNRKARGSV
jgi:hypothetical protein